MELFTCYICHVCHVKGKQGCSPRGCGICLLTCRLKKPHLWKLWKGVCFFQRHTCAAAEPAWQLPLPSASLPPHHPHSTWTGFQSNRNHIRERASSGIISERWRLCCQGGWTRLSNSFSLERVWHLFHVSSHCHPAASLPGSVLPRALPHPAPVQLFAGRGSEKRSC